VFSTKPVLELSEFTDGDVLDVPGKPQAIHTPGHTYGASCILVGERDAILTGDPLVILHLGTGKAGARVMLGTFTRTVSKRLNRSTICMGSKRQPYSPVTENHGLAVSRAPTPTPRRWVPRDESGTPGVPWAGELENAAVEPWVRDIWGHEACSGAAGSSA
jgi:glyoxylase-like metal-dependent hydrolase (beta-lactamase superfamily II)